MRDNACNKLLDLSEQAINKFGLLKSNNIRLAFSGGKDSFTLAIILKELGISFEAMAVDMNYSAGWGDKLKNNLRPFGFELMVIDAHSETTLSSIPQQFKGHFAEGIYTLGIINPAHPIANISPCTYCYNTKMHCLAVGMGEENTGDIVFGHHSTDALASLIKSYLMYVDRKINPNDSYDTDRFRNIAISFARSLINTEQANVLCNVEEAINCGIAGTDEPPRQRMADREGIEINRPFWFVDEELIMDFAMGYSLPVEGSVCGHGATKNTRTPREIIHWEIIPILKSSDLGLNALSEIRLMLNTTIDASGHAIANVRNYRDKILGPNYKKMTAKKL